MSAKNFMVVAAILSAAIFVLPSSSSAITIEELNAQIAALLAQIQTLQTQIAQLQSGGTAAWCHTFSTNLGIGSSGSEVLALSTALQKRGYGPGGANYYDETLASYVSRFQQGEVGLSVGTGYAGPITRAKLNEFFACSTSGSGSGTGVGFVQVTSPTAGQNFAIGSQLTIQWAPASTGVAAISLAPTGGGPEYFIYAFSRLGNPVNYSGSFTYALSGNFIPAGSYNVKLYNPEAYVGDNQGPGTVIGQSAVFTIGATGSGTGTGTGATVPTLTILFPPKQANYVQYSLDYATWSESPTTPGATYEVKVMPYGSSVARFSATVSASQANCNSSNVCSYPVSGIVPVNSSTTSYTLTVRDTQSGASDSTSFSVTPGGTAPIQQTVSISPPATGAFPLRTGDVASIAWTTQFTGSTSFYYEGPTGQQSTLIRSVVGPAGDFNWTVPSGITGDWRIRGANANGNFYSPVFSIISATSATPTLTILFPPRQANSVQSSLDYVTWSESPTTPNATYSIQVTRTGSNAIAFSATVSASQAACNSSNVCSYPVSGVVPVNSTSTAYNLTIRDTRSGASDSSSFFVTPGSASGSTVLASPTSLSFTVQQGASNPAAQTLTVTGSNVSWVVSVASTPSGWLSTNMTGSTRTNNGTISVYANNAGLSAGTYRGSVTVSSAGNPEIVIPVTLTVTAAPTIPAISSIQGYNQSTGIYSGQGTPGQYLIIYGTNFRGSTGGGDTVSFNGSACSASSAVCTMTYDGSNQINVLIGSSVGSGVATIQVSNSSGQSNFYPFNIGTGTARASISISPTTLNFTATAGAAPAPRTFTITNTGTVMANWGILITYNGATVTPSSGSLSPGVSQTVTVNIAATANAGTYNGTIDVGGDNITSQTISVTNTVSPSGTGGGSGSVNPSASLSLSAYRSGFFSPIYSNFFVGDYFTLNLTSNQPNTSLQLCSNLSGNSSGYNHTNRCIPAGPTDSAGSYTWNGSWDNTFKGDWTEWVQFGSYQSPQISFSVN